MSSLLDEVLEAHGGLERWRARRWVRPIRPGSRSLPFPTLVWIELSELHVDEARREVR
jgi:hypothetical protein